MLSDKRADLYGILILCLTLLVPAGKTVAQFEHKRFYSNVVLEGKVHYGFLYPQHLELELFNAHFPAFEFIIQQHTFGKHQWERDYNYPMIGASLFYSGIGNHPSLGEAFAVMPFINFPIVKTPDFTAGFRIALGAGYITRPFDRLTNYQNLAIGSHLNAAVNLMAELRFRLNYFLSLTAGASLQHFSNGSLKLPNYGINLPLIHLGLAYRPFRENQNITDRFIAPTKPYSAIVRRYVEISVGGLTGFKNMQAVYGQNYWVIHLFANGFVRVSPKSKFGLGLDASFDPSHIKTLEMKGDTVKNNLSVIRPGINGGYQLTVSKLAFNLNLGYYLGGKETSNGPLYEKISVQYNFTRDLFATIMLKVHWGRADYIGWGIGYNFNVLYGKKTVR